MKFNSKYFLFRFSFGLVANAILKLIMKLYIIFTDDVQKCL